MYPNPVIRLFLLFTDMGYLDVGIQALGIIANWILAVGIVCFYKFPDWLDECILSL